MRKVFISHSYGDREYAEKLRQALADLAIESAFDPVEPASGEILSAKLRESIQAADAVVVLLSEHALSSKWVMFELGVAEGLRKNTVPVILSTVDVDKLDFLERDRAVLDARRLSPEEAAERIRTLAAIQD